MTSPIPGFNVQSRNTPQWNPEKQLWEWWLIAQKHNAGDGNGADGGDGGKAELAAATATTKESDDSDDSDDSSKSSSAEAFHPDDRRAKNYLGEAVPITNLTLYCTSPDGEAWSFPSLGLFEWCAQDAIVNRHRANLLMRLYSSRVICG
eukprot:SAG11_NODE_3408_length_2465_cov_3.113694_4_plen_149_part_00